MTREEAKAYVEHWKRVGPLLEEIRREELRRYRTEDNVAAIHALMELGGQFAQPRPTSGLVELQRKLHRTLP